MEASQRAITQDGDHTAKQRSTAGLLLEGDTASKTDRTEAHKERKAGNNTDLWYREDWLKSDGQAERVRKKEVGFLCVFLV